MTRALIEAFYPRPVYAVQQINLTTKYIDYQNFAFLCPAINWRKPNEKGIVQLSFQKILFAKGGKTQRRKSRI